MIPLNAGAIEPDVLALVEAVTRGLFNLLLTDAAESRRAAIGDIKAAAVRFTSTVYGASSAVADLLEALNGVRPGAGSLDPRVDPRPYGLALQRVTELVAVESVVKTSSLTIERMTEALREAVGTHKASSWDDCITKAARHSVYANTAGNLLAVVNAQLCALARLFDLSWQNDPLAIHEHLALETRFEQLHSYVRNLKSSVDRSNAYAEIFKQAADAAGCVPMGGLANLKESELLAWITRQRADAEQLGPVQEALKVAHAQYASACSARDQTREELRLALLERDGARTCTTDLEHQLKEACSARDKAREAHRLTLLERDAARAGESDTRYLLERLHTELRRLVGSDSDKQSSEA